MSLFRIGANLDAMNSLRSLYEINEDIYHEKTPQFHNNHLIVNNNNTLKNEIIINTDSITNKINENILDIIYAKQVYYCENYILPDLKKIAEINPAFRPAKESIRTKIRRGKKPKSNC